MEYMLMISSHKINSSFYHQESPNMITDLIARNIC